MALRCSRRRRRNWVVSGAVLILVFVAASNRVWISQEGQQPGDLNPRVTGSAAARTSEVTTCDTPASTCSIELVPVNARFSKPLANRVAVIMPRTADPSCWAAADIGGTTLILSSLSDGDASPVSPPPPGTVVWAARAPSQCRSVLGDDAAAFPGITTALPGIAAALRIGAPTLAYVSNPMGCQAKSGGEAVGTGGAIAAPGLIFPTDVEVR
jgi:hypothetical protein